MRAPVDKIASNFQNSVIGLFIFISVATVMTVGGCSVTRTDLLDYGTPIACKSSLGAYSLSRSVVVVTVKETVKDGNSNLSVPPVQIISKPDSRHFYCLDYLSSPTADEKIFTKRNDDGLLQLVSSDILDQSRYIIVQFLKIFFNISAAGGLPRGETTAGVSTIFSYELDPFDFVNTAVLNKRLSELGFCFILADYSFDPGLAGVNAYCNNPEAVIRKAPPKWTRLSSQGNAGGYANSSGVYSAVAVPQEPIVTDERMLRGILYRPKVPYAAFWFRKDHTEGWRLAQREQLMLENVSPILSIGVNRSFFAQRVSVLLFDRGVLQNVCIYKSSELVEIAKIPFAVASAIVALPTTIFQLRINDDGNQSLLLRAQEEFYKAQLAALESQTVSAPSPGTPSMPSSILDSHFDEAVSKDDQSLLAPKQNLSFGGKNSDASAYNCPSASSIEQAVSPEPVATGFN